MNTPPTILVYSQQTCVGVELTPALPKNHHQS